MASDIPRIVIAGVHSAVGKTSVSIGVMRALRNRGLQVQPFKIGPDFLDPFHHRAACGIDSKNLDAYMLGRNGCVETFNNTCIRSGADIAVIEGCMGLFDGVDGKCETGSTAEMAKWLDAPVLLVVDAWCMSRSVAAMVHGYKSFDPALQVPTVIFNKVAGGSTGAHGAWLREAVASSKLTKDVAVIGCLPQDVRVHQEERHLGLHQPGESGVEAGEVQLHHLSGMLESHADLSKLVDVASAFTSTATPVSTSTATSTFTHESDLESELPRVRIAVAKDNAFCFYYHDNLQMLADAGAEILPFSPTTDHALPHNTHFLYLGGGYPELYARALSL